MHQFVYIYIYKSDITAAKNDSKSAFAEHKINFSSVLYFGGMKSSLFVVVPHF